MPGSTNGGGARVDWLDPLKGLALWWIFTNHVAERLFGYPYIANPSSEWPALSDRIAQLRPLGGLDLWTVPANLVRYVGWMGDQGVQLFLILSGFGLTWGLLSRSAAELNWREFYWRRLARLFPLWWASHLLFVAFWLVTGWGLSPATKAFYFSMAGFRATPEMFYFFSPAWWFIGLLVQLYLAYPFLRKALNRVGPGRLLAVTCCVAFLIRGAGLFLFDGYLDAWQRGAIFITRLPEFVFGISLAAWVHRASTDTQVLVFRPAGMLLGACAYAAGLALSLTLGGMAVAPFLLGVGALVCVHALWRLIGAKARRLSSLTSWTGRHSYSLYLTHHPFVMLFVPAGLAQGPWSTAASVSLAVALTVLSALLLEWVTDRAAKLWTGRRALDAKRAGLAVPGAAVSLVACLVVSEYAVRRLDPQEVLGWGERPSLVPSDRFGWHLKPSDVTRLRWESYDYTLEANDLGFPGPRYADVPEPDTFRILVTGDAFSSAEGVDTAQAWPRLLEKELGERMAGRKVEVLNFAITGYGPNQYAAIAQTFVPRFRPELVLVEAFVNEFQDVLLTDEDFRSSIGFDRPDQDGLSSYVRLEHLSRFLRLRWREPLRAIVRGKPEPQGYFLGNFQSLEKDWPQREAAAQKVRQRFREISDTSRRQGATLVVAMVPAPVQVCTAGQLRYFPRHVNLSDEAKFDLDVPQRLFQQIASEAGAEFIDLRPVLRGAPECPYQPRNMHWTSAGHALIARYLAQRLSEWEVPGT